MDELHRVLSLADEILRHKILRIPEQVYGKLAGTAPASDRPAASADQPAATPSAPATDVEREPESEAADAEPAVTDA
jgi:hypothetical protein